jgi:integrase
MATKSGRQRRNNTGSIRARGQDRWQLVYTLRSGTGDARKQGYETFTGTRQQAEARLREILTEIDQRTHVERAKESTATYLKRWLDLYAVNTRETTFRGYEGIVRRYLVPMIGDITLGDLEPDHIQGMYKKMLASGKSAQTVMHTHRLLSQILGQAAGQRPRVIQENPCDFVNPPKVDSQPQATLDDSTLGTFHSAIEDSPYREVYLTAIDTGCRRSELLGLRWQFCDLDGKAVMIVAGLHRLIGATPPLQLRETKTARSRRRISITSDLVDTLRQLKVRKMEGALKAGIPWREDGYVFAKADLSPFDPEKVSKDFTARMQAAGIKGITLHNLRHTMATLALDSGVSTNVVQERLGHASAKTTHDIYAHVMPGAHVDAAERIAERVRRNGSRIPLRRPSAPRSRATVGKLWADWR